jgi:hypothetical protein
VFRNRVTEMLGVEIPIVQAPMGWIARAQLASAVSNAGALGIIETSSGELDVIRGEIKKMADLTDKPFGVIIALVLLAGCNQFWGLDPTKLASTIDAPPSCRDELAFDFVPVRVASAGGFPLAYNTDEARTIAVADQFKIVEGAADVDALRPAVLEPPLAMETTATIPRLSPEGDELFVHLRENAANPRIARYSRQGAVWKLEATTNLPVTPRGEISSPTRRLPGGRRILIGETGQLQEFVESAPDKWMPIGDPFPSVMPFGVVKEANLTADGLRVIYIALLNEGETLRYHARADVASPWGAPRDLPRFFGRPPLDWPFMTADCGRLYALTASEGVFYLKQP